MSIKRTLKEPRTYVIAGVGMIVGPWVLSKVAQYTGVSLRLPKA